MTVRQLQNGVSGLRSQRDAVDVVADNVANVNTPGFKRQRAGFEDVFNGNGGIGSGGGSRLTSVQQLFTQGSIATTGVSTDVALSGEGFFAVAGSVNGVTSTFYSRTGSFRLDPSGNLVDASGLMLLGRMMQPDGRLAASVRPLVVPTGAVPATPTSTLDIVVNLDATEPVATDPFDPQNPGGTSSLGTSFVVYDSLGAPHSLDVYFNKVAPSQWEYRVVASGDDLSPAQPGLNVEVGGGQLSFNSDGALQQVAVGQAISLDFAQAAPGQAISLGFGTPIANGGTGLDGATQFGMPSAVSSQSQNGAPSGDLSGISIDADGMVIGQYTNGRGVPIGQLQVALFRAPDKLARAGNNLWLATSDSGSAVLGGPGAGGRAAVVSGAIEQSNVDLGQEMVSIIQHQRAFGASSKVIAAADDLLSELMQIKR